MRKRSLSATPLPLLLLLSLARSLTPSVETLLVDSIKEMSDRGLGCLLVADAAGRFLGAFTDGDLRRQLNAHGAAALQARQQFPPRERLLDARAPAPPPAS